MTTVRTLPVNKSQKISDLISLTVLVIVSTVMIWIYTISPNNALVILGLAAGVTVFIYSLCRITSFLLTLLILRSSLDVFTKTAFSLGGVNINIASLLSMIILLGGGIYLFRSKDNAWPLISIIFVAWVLSLVPFGVLSYFNFGLRSISSAKEFIRITTVIMIFVLTYNLVNPDNKQLFFNVIMLSLFIPLLTGYYQLITGTGMDIEGVHRIHGTMVHPNHLALFLVMFIGLTYWRWRINFAAKWGMLLIALLIALMATVSLTGLIMFGLLAFVLLWHENFHWRLMIFGTLLTAIIILSQVQQVQNRISELQDLNWQRGIQQHQVTGSFAWRICNFWNLIELWEKQPYLGYGLETTKNITPTYIRHPIYLYARPAPAHNDFLKYLVETGIVGFFLYLIFNLLILFAIYREYRAARDIQLKGLIYTLFAVYLVWQIGSLSDNLMTATAVQFSFWAVLGVALKCRSLENDLKFSFPSPGCS